MSVSPSFVRSCPLVLWAILLPVACSPDAEPVPAPSTPAPQSPESSAPQHERHDIPTLVEQAWDDPVALDRLVESMVTQGLAGTAVEPARRLLEIHDDSERAAVLLGTALTQSRRGGEAVVLFESWLAEHGDSALVLTNLARALSVIERPEEAEDVLWRALEADPNQEAALVWMETIHRERDGRDAQRAVLEKATQFAGAWRPWLWLAQMHLEDGELDAALAIYRDQLAAATEHDGLTAICGALAQHGYPLRAVELVAPVYVVAEHDPGTGLNLLQAYRELGRDEEAERLWDQLAALPRPDPRRPDLEQMLARLKAR